MVAYRRRVCDIVYLTVYVISTPNFESLIWYGGYSVVTFRKRTSNINATAKIGKKSSIEIPTFGLLKFDMV